MKLAVSNIAWLPADDEVVYARMQALGFAGLEIAPTRWIAEAPYAARGQAQALAARIRQQTGFGLPSMQSILFGRTERLFGPEAERVQLAHHVRQAIDFAVAIDCRNLVFGSPRNRALPEGADPQLAIGFFKDLGHYAAAQGVTLSLEPNPALYGTNFINTTRQAVALVRAVASPGFRVNLDVGTLVANEECLADMDEAMDVVNHVHISEPLLAPIQERDLHRTLKAVLEAHHYAGWVSLEMKAGEVDRLLAALAYVARVFGD